MKKDKSRFTLRLCSVAPKHINATHVLIAAGRRKSMLIADLIDEHIKRYGENAFVDYFHTTALPQGFFHSITIPQTATQADSLPARTSKLGVEADKFIESLDEADKPISSSSNESLNDEIRDAVLDGLGMFGRA